MNPLIGRAAEQQLLQRTLDSKKSELLAIYGRRRVGKTFLINSFFRGRAKVFELTGAPRASLAEQLESFHDEFRDVFSAVALRPNSWQQAFGQLRRQAEAHPAAERKLVLFFDELPWLAKQRSGFLSALEHTYNRYLSRLPNVIVVVCGSAASWMLNHVVHDRAGLHGRLTQKIRLMPFSLAETELFLQSLGLNLDRRQLVELYMVFGGVAKYLEQCRPGRSAVQLIDDACFSPTGYLHDEYPDLMRSLFKKSQRHVSVVQALAKRRSGLLMPELLRQAKLKSGGTTSGVIQELVESGFVAKTPGLVRQKRDAVFRLLDEYTQFYLTWIEPVRGLASSLEPGYWLRQQRLPTYRSWAGHTFETLCLKFVTKIKAALGIAGVVTRALSCYSGASDRKGFQIDLIIDRDDHCINLCELKYHAAPIRVDRRLAEALVQRRERFITETGTQKTVFTTLITANGVHDDANFRAAVHHHLTMDALF